MRTRLVVPIVVVLVLMVSGGIWAVVSLLQEPSTSGGPRLVSPTSAQVASADARRRTPGAQVRDVTLTAAPAKVDLGNRVVTTWAFNGKVPGPTLRLEAGDVVRAKVVNHLPAALTVHWHGIALRNDMDGVPDLTQHPIHAGKSFTYTFTAPDPGTYFYHPHTGTQLDRGLYGALIVTAPAQPVARTDIPLLLDDWIDGTGQDPDQVLGALEHGMKRMQGMGSMSGMDMGNGSDMPGMDMSNGSDMRGKAMSGPSRSPLGADISDVRYPFMVMNGRVASDPRTFRVSAGQTVRLRLINAAAATPFRVAFAGGRMTVVATDGFPVKPVRTDALLIGMGERYDVEVTIPRQGVFPVVAEAEGQSQQAMAVLQAGTAALPAPGVHPAQLEGHLLSLDQLHATPAAALPAGSVDRTYRVDLTGSMATFDWRIASPKERGVSLPVRVGERVRLIIRNRTTMWHPIHLHGHTFQVGSANANGPRKDTVVVGPKLNVTIELIADNPGRWVLHCHNVYHAEAGMMTTLNYLA